jgi:hypothetical protein
MPVEMQGNPQAITLGEVWRNILTDNGSIGSLVDITSMDNILHVFEHGMFRATAGCYGYGNDGKVTFDGTAVVLGLTPSTGVYTLTRDIYLASGSVITSAATITTAGFRIFCQGILTNNGTIRSNGNAAAANTAGALLSYAGTISNTTVGTAGAAGGTGAGTAGTNGGANGLGGVGGAGGNNASVPNAGGAGGTITAPLATVEGPYSADLAVKARVIGTTAFALLQGGAGGGAGGGDGTNLSGGGGGGGGIIVVAAKTLVGTGTISAQGGAGGAANATGTPSGGGGGGGGCIIIISTSVMPFAVTGVAAALIAGQNTATVAGGAAGAAGAGGGTPGNAGLAGSLLLIPG